MAFSIIIPSGSESNRAVCIKAIREAGEKCRIIVVDNSPSRVDTCRDDGGNVTIIPGAKPFIFARNFNIDVLAAQGDDIITLGDDVILDTALGFSKLAALAKSNPDYGVISAASNFVGNTNQYPQSHINSRIPPFRPDPLMLCFVCVYIPRSTIGKVGLMDEQFVDYGFDDDDYSWRVREAGLKLGVFDGCYANHCSLPSVWRGGVGKGNCDGTGNMRRFIAKWGVDNKGLTREQSPFSNLFPADSAR